MFKDNKATEKASLLNLRDRDLGKNLKHSRKRMKVIQMPLHEMVHIITRS
jgi:hypothetical protein